jgi:hypothetical protein
MRVLLLAASLLFTAVGFAQEGHPLVGSWHGTWGPNAQTRHDVTVVLFWDGKAITGMINPGLDVVKIQNATLDPSNDPANWKVHFEGDTKDKAHIVVDGKIENLTNLRRSIAGTWTQGGQKGDFKITRDS